MLEFEKVAAWTSCKKQLECSAKAEYGTMLRLLINDGTISKLLLLPTFPPICLFLHCNYPMNLSIGTKLGWLLPARVLVIRS